MTRIYTIEKPAFTAGPTLKEREGRAVQDLPAGCRRDGRGASVYQAAFGIAVL
jgi:hypothetical protein